MMNLRNAIALLRLQGMCCPRKGSLSLVEIRESARWPPGKITTKALSRSEPRSAQHLADFRGWLGVDRRVRTFRVQSQPRDPSGYDKSAFINANCVTASSSLFHTFC